MRTITRAAATVAAAAIALLGTMWLASGDRAIAGSAAPDPDAPPPLTMLEAVVSSCSAGEIRDGGDTLVLDMYVEGVDTPLASGITVDDIACVLGELNMPASLTERMDRTRALDGVQEASWGDLTASWTYHPDAGLDIILSLAP